MRRAELEESLRLAQNAVIRSKLFSEDGRHAIALTVVGEAFKLLEEAERLWLDQNMPPGGGDQGP